MKNLTLFADAGRRKTSAAWSYLIVNSNNDIIDKNGGLALGDITHNIVEYMSIIKGLEATLKLIPDSLIIISDSQVCIEQLKGNYKCKSSNLKPLYIKAKDLISRFKCPVNIEWKSRENEFIRKCDKLCNEVMDQYDIMDDK